MIRVLLLILAAYILYKLIFDFIIPVVRTTRTIKKQFRNMNQEMQDKMNQHNSQQSQQQTQAGFGSSQTDKKPASDKDYIDFEEVK